MLVGIIFSPIRGYQNTTNSNAEPKGIDVSGYQVKKYICLILSVLIYACL